MKTKKSIINLIKVFFEFFISGDYLCKIGLHKYNYHYERGMTGWIIYHGYCERCGNYTSGLD